MRLLGAAAAAAVGRGPLPRVLAVLGWQRTQVVVPSEARLNLRPPGTLRPSGARDTVAPLPSLALPSDSSECTSSCLSAEKPLGTFTTHEQRLGALGGWTGLLQETRMVKPLGFGMPSKEVTGVKVKTGEKLVRPGLEPRAPDSLSSAPFTIMSLGGLPPLLGDPGYLIWRSNLPVLFYGLVSAFCGGR